MDLINNLLIGFQTSLSLMNLDRMTMGAGGGVFGSGITPAARALACTENVPSCCAMEAIDG